MECPCLKTGSRPCNLITTQYQAAAAAAVAAAAVAAAAPRCQCS